MDELTRERYIAWQRRKIIKLAIAPVLVLLALIFGFIWGRRSVTIPECEECPPVIECPEPVECEIPNDYGDDNYPYGNPYSSYNPYGNYGYGEPYEEPPVQWDQP